MDTTREVESAKLLSDIMAELENERGKRRAAEKHLEYILAAAQGLLDGFDSADYRLVSTFTTRKSPEWFIDQLRTLTEVAKAGHL